MAFRKRQTISVSTKYPGDFPLLFKNEATCENLRNLGIDRSDRIIFPAYSILTSSSLLFTADQRKSVKIGSPSSTVFGLFRLICGHLRWFADKFSVGESCRLNVIGSCEYPYQ